MYSIELWIDIECKDSERNETVCTLFGRLQIPKPPAVGERLSFHQDKSTHHEFSLVSESGIHKSHIVSVEVEDVSLYAMPHEGGILWNTSVRCWGIAVPTLEDARNVCTLMRLFGFEIDPYGVNKLES